MGGRLVKLDVSREETFVNNRVRHAIKYHIVSWVKPDGTFVARKLECYSDQGAYGSHGHSIVAKGLGAFAKMFPCPNVEADAYTVYTNKPVGGAMRGYGMPQASFAFDCATEDIAKELGIDSLELRRKTLMPKGFKDGFFKTEQYYDSYNQCLDKAVAYIDYEK